MNANKRMSLAIERSIICALTDGVRSIDSVIEEVQTKHNLPASDLLMTIGYMMGKDIIFSPRPLTIKICDRILKAPSTSCTNREESQK